MKTENDYKADVVIIGGINGKSSLEGTFISNCILTGRIAARSICG